MKKVPSPNWHVTLKFLGSAGEESVPHILAAMKKVLRGPGFPITFEGTGAFPTEERATAVWIGITKGGEELAGLAQALDGELERAGFEREARTFEPHLTVGRVKPAKNIRPALSKILIKPISMEATRVVLYQSFTHPTGPEYRELGGVDLSG